jgi:hypothetical protein
MWRTRPLVWLTLVFVVSVASEAIGQSTSQPSCGTCTSTLDLGDEPCTGARGCSGSYPVIVCSFGCSCGACHSQGSSGECCGHRYYLPNVYPQPGICSGSGCGELPRHARTHSRDRDTTILRSVELRQDYSPGLIVLTPTIGYRPPVFVYALDCSHSYQLVVEEAPL